MSRGERYWPCRYCKALAACAARWTPARALMRLDKRADLTLRREPLTCPEQTRSTGRGQAEAMGGRGEGQENIDAGRRIQRGIRDIRIRAGDERRRPHRACRLPRPQGRRPDPD